MNRGAKFTPIQIMVRADPIALPKKSDTRGIVAWDQLPQGHAAPKTRTKLYLGNKRGMKHPPASFYKNIKAKKVKADIIQGIVHKDK
jgi:hypothetical protein